MMHSAGLTQSKGRVVGLAFLTLTLLVPMADATAQECVPDQQQISRNYGFDFSDEYDRWQEFVPQYTNLCSVELVLLRNVTPSRLDVTIEDAGGNVIWNGTETILLTGLHWHTITFDSGVKVVAGMPYKLRFRGLEPSPDPDNRMFWDGKTESNYDAGVSDVDPDWPGFDYCFRFNASGSVPTGMTSWGTLKARHE